jgi:hypothetical protein
MGGPGHGHWVQRHHVHGMGGSKVAVGDSGSTTQLLCGVGHLTWQSPHNHHVWLDAFDSAAALMDFILPLPLSQYRLLGP